MRNNRSRLDSSDDSVERLPDAEGTGSSGVLAVTFTETTYPTAAGKVYATHPVSLNGTEAEGDTPSYVADTAVTLYGYNVGTTVPPSGTYLILTAVGGRWVFRYDA